MAAASTTFVSDLLSKLNELEVRGNRPYSGDGMSSFVQRTAIDGLSEVSIYHSNHFLLADPNDIRRNTIALIGDEPSVTPYSLADQSNPETEMYIRRMLQDEVDFAFRQTEASLSSTVSDFAYTKLRARRYALNIHKAIIADKLREKYSPSERHLRGDLTHLSLAVLRVLMVLDIAEMDAAMPDSEQPVLRSDFMQVAVPNGVDVNRPAAFP